MITNIGADFGNRQTKVAIEIGDKILCASVPSLYAFDCPEILRSGQEKSIDAFSLLFRVENRGDAKLWFGNDVLASENTMTELYQAKYSKSYIQRLFQAVLYEWSRKHKISLSELGKLNICVSMPPGSYQTAVLRKQAEKAYRSAFNTGQSHIQLRDGKETIQIVTQFHSLVREAVVWGSDIPRQNEIVIVIDFGGGTDDIAMFNGSDEPISGSVRSYKTGLINTYKKINPINKERAELKIFRDKNYMPFALVTYFNQKKLFVQLALSDLSDSVSKRVYLIGGGAKMIDRHKDIKSQFVKLLPPKKLIIKDHFANARANLKEASK